MKNIFWAVICVAMFLGTEARADLTTALPRTISEIPFGADNASMGNANVAAPTFSSKNPSVIAIESEDKSKFGATATYGMISFKSGSSVSLYSLSGLAKMPVGNLQITLSNAGSNVGTLSDGSKLQFNSNPGIDLQYGLPVAKNFLLADDALYLGVSYSYSQSKITMAADPFLFTTKSQGSSVGVGGLYRIAKVVNLGAFYDHSWDRSDEFFDGAFDTTTKSQSNKLRLGIGVQIPSTMLPPTFLAADYQHLYLPNGERDDQYFAGIEQYLIKDALAVYGGWANGGITAGLGIYLEHGGINLAYMHRPFRATEEFLGKAEMLMASIYGTF